MAVLIFPLDYKKLSIIAPDGTENLSLQPLIDGCLVQGVALAKGDYKETMHGKGSELPDGSEIIDGPSTIKVINLPFTADDIPDFWSFGNGCTVGSLLLKDGRKFPCAWIVLPTAAVPAAAKLNALAKILKD